MRLTLLLVASILLCGTAAAAVPSSINNDDGCDIKVAPAATLLLPYFDVDTNGASGRTTLFTITNVTRYPQIAHVTLWTDWAYPVMTFNLFLTGYDLQAINLADVLVRGSVAPPSGTSQTMRPGTLSENGNPNLRAPLDCTDTPGTIPEPIMAEVRTALTTGVIPTPGATGCHTVGGPHLDAVGYATIDIVASCTGRTPLDPSYYTTDLLFDNVLIGDYQQIGANPAGATVRSAFDAAGNPMVHIRAVPEGGGAGSNVSTALPYTFYDRYTPGAKRTIDRRQPLPSTFAARFIQGGPAAFATNYTVWREGMNGAAASCAAYGNTALMPTGEVIRFDEHENPFAFLASPICGPCMGPFVPPLPATSSTSSAGSLYPSLTGPDVAGWLYFNLNNGGANTYSVTYRSTGTATSAPTAFGTPRASQNWVTVSMFGNAGTSHMTAELDAAPFGNGCSPAADITGGVISGPRFGPVGGVFVCPPNTTLTNGSTTLCTGTNANPTP